MEGFWFHRVVSLVLPIWGIDINTKWLLWLKKTQEKKRETGEEEREWSLLREQSRGGQIGSQNGGIPVETQEFIVLDLALCLPGDSFPCFMSSRAMRGKF